MSRRLLDGIETKVLIEQKREIQMKLLSLGWEIQDLVSKREEQLFSDGDSTRVIFKTDKSNCAGFTQIDVDPMNFIDKGDSCCCYAVQFDDIEKMREALSASDFGNKRILEFFQQTWINALYDSDLSIVFEMLPFATILRVRGGYQKVEELLEQLDLIDAEKFDYNHWAAYENFCKVNSIEERQNIVFGGS